MEFETRNPRRRGRRPAGGQSSRLRRRIRAYRDARLERERQLPPRIAVPSFFTLMNLFSGFLAIIQISEGRPAYAAWLIVLASFFDLLDGMMARLADAASDFGIELDSLADVVSFGIAPSFLVYHNGLKEFGTLGLLVAALPALCGAVRLARYNVMSDQGKKDHFTGMPIPAQAATLVSFILTFEDPTWFAPFAAGKLSILIPLVVGLSALMVTSVKFDAVPQPSRGYIRTHKLQTISFVLGVLAVIFFQEVGLFVGMIYYIFLALGRTIAEVARNLWNGEDEEEAVY